MSNTISPNNIVLYDMIGGPVAYDIPPADASGWHFANTSHHNVATAGFTPGKRVAVWDDTNSGWSILAYLRGTGTQTVTGITAGVVCGHFATYAWYYVGPTTSTCVDGPFCAIPVATVTTTYYGWYWIAGVCPNDWVASFQDAASATSTILPTDGSVTASNDIMLLDSSGLKLATKNSATVGSVGWALVTDVA